MGTWTIGPLAILRGRSRRGGPALRVLSLLALVGLAQVITQSSNAASPPAKPAPDRGRVTAPPRPAAENTSAPTGNELNTTSWPIDQPVHGGVMRKLPGHRDWVFVPGLTDAQMRQLGKTREVELLRLHGSEPREVEIAVPDSSVLRKMARLGLSQGCPPPCTLATRVLYRQLPQFASESLLFWCKGDRSNSAPGVRRRSLPPDANLPASRPDTTKGGP